MTNTWLFPVLLVLRMVSGRIVIVTSDEPKLIGYCEVIRQELGQREVTYRMEGEVKSITAQS